MINIYCSIKVYISILTYLLTKILNIDIDIAIFRKYRIEIEQISDIEASLTVYSDCRGLKPNMIQAQVKF